MFKLAHASYLTVIAVLVAVLWQSRNKPADLDEDTAARSHIASIAVLPFVAVGATDSAQQVADAVTTGVTESLSRMPGLAVTPEDETSPFAQSNLSLHDIGGRLGVSAILEGAVRSTQE